LPIEANDLDRLVKTLEAMLDRFKQSGSIRLVDCSPASVQPAGKGKNASSVVNLSLPKGDIAKRIRECWKQDRRAMPCAGIVFPDDSIMTVMFVCKSMPIPKQLGNIQSDIQILGASGPVGYVAQYGYCFYPNSKQADSIGYFRYDYHYESMGDGDLGEHNYFHFHRTTEDEFRHATGPMLEFDKIVSGIERVLAPKERQKRLEKTFLSGQFEKLLLDLTVEGILSLNEDLREQKLVDAKFKYRKDFEQFVEQNI
jgi:hypothetical protein